jgi:hypothetical protein
MPGSSWASTSSVRLSPRRTLKRYPGMGHAHLCARVIAFANGILTKLSVGSERKLGAISCQCLCTAPAAFCPVPNNIAAQKARDHACAGVARTWGSSGLSSGCCRTAHFVVYSLPWAAK